MRDTFDKKVKDGFYHALYICKSTVNTHYENLQGSFVSGLCNYNFAAI